jgi:putative aminopeptidase FrvX
MQYEALYARLAMLVETCGVSGNEAPVAAEVERQLSAAEFPAGMLQSDALGNRWLSFGPDGPPQRLLVAHLDEIGLRISSIRLDGLCRVVPCGGIDPQLWEGTSVLVHAADGRQVPGCIAPVSLHVTQRQGLGPKQRLEIHDLLLDLGCASAAEVASLGIALLDSVTWPKTAQRVGPDGRLVQARSLDDRFGCTALIECAIALRDNPPPVPTVLAWAVQEELGLRGAKALARRFPACREVIAVDSYTVAGTPRDNQQFAAATLGGGPVLRCFDNTTLVPEPTRRMLLEQGRQLGYGLQSGYMPGGNDASAFEDSGAAVFGLGVALAHSHSAVERIHLGDLAALCALLAAWCGTEQASTT